MVFVVVVVDTLMSACYVPVFSLWENLVVEILESSIKAIYQIENKRVETLSLAGKAIVCHAVEMWLPSTVQISVLSICWVSCTNWCTNQVLSNLPYTGSWYVQLMQ